MQLFFSGSQQTIRLADAAIQSACLNCERAYRPWTIGHIKIKINPMARAPDIGVIFGEVLRRHRSAMDISQEELAFLSGVDRTFVSRLERGIRQPTITTMIGIGQALGISAADLVRETEAEFLRKAKKIPVKQ